MEFYLPRLAGDSQNLLAPPQVYLPWAVGQCLMLSPERAQVLYYEIVPCINVTIIDDFSTILENVGEKYPVFILHNYLDVFDLYFCKV